MRIRKTTPLCAAAASLLLSAGLSPAHAAASFEGKTIRMIINFGVGGPLDTFFRAFMPYLERHLPGRPTIIVENRPGAAGRVGAAYLYNVAKPDGLTIGGMVGVANDAIFGLPVKYEAAKFTWLGAVPQTQVTVVTTDLGVTTPAGLQSPSKPIVMAMTGKSSNNFIATSLALDMMKVPFKAVQGYAGQAATVHALRQGEANMTDVGAPLYLPNRESWRAENLVRAVLQRGDLQPDGSFRRSPLIPDVTTMPEAIEALNPAALKSVEFKAYRLIAGTYALQYSLVAPPGVAPAVAEALRAGVAAAMRDPEAVAKVKQTMRLEYNFLDAKEAMLVFDKLDFEAKETPAARALLAKLAQVK